MQLLCACLDRSANVRDSRQFLVIDDHGFRGIASLVLGLGDHYRDSLADETHGFRRHRRPCAHLHAGAIFGSNCPAADEITDLVIDDLLAGEDANDAGHLHRGG
jgi:hypothetical protein